MKNIIMACAAALTATTLSTAPVKASSNPLLGEIMTVGFNFCPRGWLATNGQLLPISQYSALFSLLGTTYGGDGRTTFALPDLRGRASVHIGTGPGLPNISWGQKGGAVTATLNANTMPPHSHGATSSAVSTLKATDEGAGTSDADGAALASATIDATGGDLDLTMESGSVGTTVTTTVASAGGGQPFSIQNPFLGNLHCIATQGIFPTRNLFA